MSHNIKVLHIEPTDACNLACPLCARETDPLFIKQQSAHLTIEQIMQVVNLTDIKNLNKMFMCGNYGDPAAGKHTLEIFKYFREINPNIILGMNTNGSLQNTKWWTELASILTQPCDYVVWSIDGLENTNHVYRINSNWKKIMTNAQSFIKAGGSAHWDMLVYKHNEHQVDLCQQTAKELGFKWFRAKISKRPLANKLEYPILWSARSYEAGNIECHALKEQSIYIDAHGRRSPCCWLGSRQSNFITDISEVQETWNSKHPNTICVNTCSTRNNISNFDSQWRREVNLCN